MKRIYYILIASLLSFSGCGSDSSNNDEPKDQQGPVLVSSNPIDGASDLAGGETTITLNFDKNITLITPHNITLNNENVEVYSAVYKTIIINTKLSLATNYELVIPANKVKGPDGVFAGEIKVSFSTKEKTEIASALTNPNASTQALKVYNFLKENYQKKLISASMANITWNFNEANIVYSWTGRYPAMATMDYIHLPYSPADWIDYSKTEDIEAWWNNNGLIAAGWHWLVPKSESDTSIDNYTYQPDKTTFKASNVVIEGTWENSIAKQDLEEMAGYLKLLADKNIPVIWRPLHEAAGNTYEYTGGKAWFWWGYSGAQAYKELWIYMYNYFKNAGVNNLIWVWTSQTKDSDFYPGDEYVDIVGRDIYTKTAKECAENYKTLEEQYPNKIITLSECGSVGKISEQWSNGARWSYYMPWCMYNATVDNALDHEHANKAWWEDAFSCDYVITRDQMPSLK